MKEIESDYFIRFMSLGHCARGPLRCEKCKEAEKNKKFYILKAVYEGSEGARPTVEINKNGKKDFVYFDVIKGFNDEKSAIDYAKKEGLKLIN